MNFKKILTSLLVLVIGQKLVNASSIGTGALIRHAGIKPITQHIATQHITPIAPSLIASKLGMQPGSSIQMAQVEIPRAKLVQYKHAMQEALQYAHSIAASPIEFQSPLKFQKPVIVSASPIESKAFRDLELVNILKNKTINSQTFRNTMIALAAMFGVYNLLDFLNNLYENNTILMWAVEADNENVAGYLLDFGADIHKQNSDGDTAMLIAARLGKAKIVELLINKTKGKYADDPKKAQEEIAKLLNTKNNDGRTALLEVVEFGNFLGGGQLADPTEKGRIDIIAIFLKNGADIRATDKNGENVLFLLANKMKAVANDKDSEILREVFNILAEEQPKALQAVNAYQDTLLLQAVKDNNVYLFNYLKDKIIDVMHPDIYGQNIIFKAVQTRNINMLKAVFDLLETKVEIKSKDVKVSETKQGVGFTTQKALSTASSFIQKLSGQDKTDLESLSKLKKYLGIKDKRGATVLDSALGVGASFSIIKLLVEKGAQPTDQQFSFAIRSNQMDIVKFFLEYSKMSPSVQDLHRALVVQNLDLLKMLLDSRHISSEVKNTFIKGALFHSIKTQNTQMFEFLFSMADAGMKESAITNAILSGNSKIINDYLNSSEVTDEMRRIMLKDVVQESKSVETLNILLHNAKAEKAYEDPTVRSLILKEAVSNLKRGVASKPGDDKITAQDIKSDPLLRTLLSAWEPKYEEGWGNWTFDKWAQFRGQRSSKEIFEDKKRAFDQDMHKIVFNENADRSASKSTTTIKPIGLIQRVYDSITKQ